MMGIQKLMHQYAGYNLWANQSLIFWLSPQSIEALSKPVMSSFPSIILTFAHLLDTEKFWLAILKGVSRQRWEPFSGPDELVMPGLIRQSEAMCAYVHSLNETDLSEVCQLDATWARMQKQRFEFIQHCFNHSAYHRGQIVTLAYHLGITGAPNTDFIFYKE